MNWDEIVSKPVWSQEEIEHNKALVQKYPFLCPTDMTPETYDGKWNWLEDLECGWKAAFGEMLCDDIKRELEENGYNDFLIVQIKEKFGSLCFYYRGGPESLRDLIARYSLLSAHVCLKCGKVGVPITYMGWIAPLCEKCFSMLYPHCTSMDYAEVTKDYLDARNVLLPTYPKIVWNRDTEQEEQVGEYDIQSLVDRIDDKFKTGGDVQ